MNWSKTPHNSYQLYYIFRLKEEKSIETSSYAWIDACSDQYFFHRDSAFEFDWGQVIQSSPVVLSTDVKMHIFREGTFTIVLHFLALSPVLLIKMESCDWVRMWVNK